METVVIVSIDVDQGFCRDSGNFFVLLRFAFPEDQGYEVTYTSGALYWNRQDTFSREYFSHWKTGATGWSGTTPPPPGTPY